MPVIGTYLDRKNPEYTLQDFLFWMPDFSTITTIDTTFNNLYPIANDKVFHSIFGSDWKYAMALCIAHYATILGRRERNKKPGAKSLADLAGGGPNVNGIMSSASVGSFTKTYDLDRSLMSGDDKMWWNTTDYGAELMRLLGTKAMPSIFVAITHPIPGSGNYEDDD